MSENSNPNEERRQGHFEGQVLTEIKGLRKDMVKLTNSNEKFEDHIFARVNKNSNDIAKQKGWVAAFSVFAAFIGSVLGVFFSNK